MIRSQLPVNSSLTLTQIRRLPKNMLNLDTGPWVCGGAVRRIIMRDEPTEGSLLWRHLAYDIDIFVPHMMFDATLDAMRNTFGSYRFRGNGVFNFLTRAITFQVVRVYGETLTDVFNTFDYTICMAATDGQEYIAVPDFARDMQNKWLTAPKRKHVTNPDRLMKYFNMGFEPGPDFGTNYFSLQNDNKSNGQIVWDKKGHS